MKTWWPFARLAFAVLGAAAVLAQLLRTLENAATQTTEWGTHLPTIAWNFLSFFTIDSNILAAVTLIIAAVWSWTAGRTEDREPTWLAVLLVCASTYMIVTGVVYNVLLRNIELPQGVTVPWSNEVLHVAFPLFLLADVLFAPRRRALPWTAMLTAVVFPIVWVVYTLVRANLIIAPATGDAWWYPYPFLNPNLVPGGYLGVAGYIIGIAITIIAAAAFVVWIGRRRGGDLEVDGRTSPEVAQRDA